MSSYYRHLACRNDAWRPTTILAEQAEPVFKDDKPLKDWTDDELTKSAAGL